MKKQTMSDIIKRVIGRNKLPMYRILELVSSYTYRSEFRSTVLELANNGEIVREWDESGLPLYSLPKASPSNQNNPHIQRMKSIAAKSGLEYSRFDLKIAEENGFRICGRCNSKAYFKPTVGAYVCFCGSLLRGGEWSESKKDRFISELEKKEIS